jgi:hypothetical protein
VGYSLSETDVAFLMITLKGDDYEAQKMIAQTETENPSFSTAYIKEWYVYTVKILNVFKNAVGSEIAHVRFATKCVAHFECIKLKFKVFSPY